MRKPASLQDLLARARAGERSSLARLLSVAEAGGPEADALDALCLLDDRERSVTVGITGAPGAGKSTLTAELLREARRELAKIAVLAIDPSSPLTGGAILGDRVRMHQAAVDDGTFIRSMASRGHQGGLALAASLATRVLEAGGWPWILLETVGIGQVEVEISAAADIVVVVLNPGWGDEIQANKAGLMEIADLFVINKADREGAAQTRRDIEAALMSRAGPPVPVIDTVAIRAEGVAELWAAIRSRMDQLAASGELARRREQRLASELAESALARLRERLAAALAGEAGRVALAGIARGEQGVREAAARLVATLATGGAPR